MKWSFFLLINIIFFSCEQAKENIIDLTDIIEESENFKEGVEKLILNDQIDSSEMLLESFNAKGFDFLSATKIDGNYFPDRFGPVRENKIELISKSDTVNYYQWIYSDSAKTMNSFYNWIDNYGEKGTSIFIGEVTKMQVNPFILFVGDSSITFIEGKSSLSYSIWEAFCSDDSIIRDWNYVVEQRKRSRAKWFVYSENKRLPLKN